MWLGAGLMVKQGGAMRVDKESTLALLVLTVPSSEVSAESCGVHGGDMSRGETVFYV